MSNKNHDTLTLAKEILAQEAHAILGSAELLNESFIKACKLILEQSNKGHVIVSGMGKAGFIGMKISATLASTGVPSFFLHPAEAVHGDLGRYTENDVALLLSHSGNTEEILRIIPQVKRIGCPVISITSSSNSPLAQYSDLVIPIGTIKEAGPLGLAPTTSTSVMLAIGDALAMCILSQQNFSPEQFAQFHPAGNLGRALIPVAEMMRKDERMCIVHENKTAKEVLHAITETVGRPGAAAIVDDQGILVGAFTDGNFRRCLEHGAAFLDEEIRLHMTKAPKAILDTALTSEAVKLIRQYKIDQLIVVNAENHPVGMIDIQDIIDIQIPKE